jgi:hypothetical protein
MLTHHFGGGSEKCERRSADCLPCCLFDVAGYQDALAWTFPRLRRWTGEAG